MSDPMGSGASGSHPVANLVSLTGDDATDLANFTRAIYVNGAGNVKITTVGGQTLTIALGAGWHPIRVKRFWAASLTATGVLGGY